MAEAGFGFGVKPQKAVEYLRQKHGFVRKLNEADFLQSARGKATKIANLSCLNMTADIYQSLAEAKEKGLSYGTWKKEMLAHFEKKGWLVGKGRKALLADPQTGELFGTPRRLDTIYRTNVQTAYSAQRYQQMMDNRENRPYWKYSAVDDSRTRPSHLAMNGLVYAYDDPFWSVFYPPNGFNCRCNVIAYSAKEVEANGFIVGNGESRLVEVERRVNKNTVEMTKAFKSPDGRVFMTDRGFDYNAGRQSYKPNLDLYPESLAHQFAKVEMGQGFKLDYAQFEKEISTYIEPLRNLSKDKKAYDKLLKKAREQLSREYKFAAGILSSTTKTNINTDFATVWLSDDTLLKQLANHPDLKSEDYAKLPDILYSPDKVVIDKENHFRFFKEIEGRKFMAVIKVLKHSREIFLQSWHIAKESQWNKAFNG